jgi:mono/diheme cytochrome c family protein
MYPKLNHKMKASFPSGANVPSVMRRYCNFLTRGRGSRTTPITLLLFLCLLFPACRQDMHDQAKYEPLEQSNFFGDNRSERDPVEGTVARGDLREDSVFYTGKAGDQPARTFPMELTESIMRRGQERFNIYCSPCHDSLGAGQGMVVRRGFKKPPSFHIDRLRQAPIGYYFDVITNGFGVMPSYKEQVPVADRWAIIAYVRALQLSQHATIDDVPESKRKELESVRGSQ